MVGLTRDDLAVVIPSQEAMLQRLQDWQHESAVEQTLLAPLWEGRAFKAMGRLALDSVYRQYYYYWVTKLTGPPRRL